MPLDWRYLMLPVVGAVVGWVTNYVAIKMLFRPYRPIRVLGFTVQGLLPRRRKEFALSIARTVERDLLTAEDIAGFLDGVHWEEEVELAVERTLESQLKKARFSVLFKTPIIGLVGREVVRQVKGIISRALIEKIGEHKEGLIDRFTDSIALEDVVSQRVEAFEMEKLESVLMNLIAKELTYIELVGAVLGFLIGLVQMAVLLIA